MFKIVALVVTLAGQPYSVMTSHVDYDTKEDCEAARPASVAKLQTDPDEQYGKQFLVAETRCLSKDELSRMSDPKA